MDDLLEFNASLNEAIRWLEKAESDLEVPIGDTEAIEAYARFTEAYKAVNAIREPLTARIKAYQEHEQEQDTRYSQ